MRANPGKFRQVWGGPSGPRRASARLRQTKAEITLVFLYPNGSVAPVFIRSVALVAVRRLRAADLTPLESLCLRIGISVEASMGWPLAAGSDRGDPLRAALLQDPRGIGDQARRDIHLACGFIANPG